VSVSEALLSWLREHGRALEIATGVAALTSLGSLIAVPWMLARIPADYFARDDAPPLPWARAHPLARWVLHSAKNVLGVALILVGTALLVLPGQGLMTLFVGFLLIDFPGKRRLEMRLVRRKFVHRVIDWIRHRAGRPALSLPPLDASAES